MGATVLSRGYCWSFDFVSGNLRYFKEFSLINWKTSQRFHNSVVAGLLDIDFSGPRHHPGDCNRLRLSAGVKVHLQVGKLEWISGKAVRAGHSGEVYAKFIGDLW